MIKVQQLSQSFHERSVLENISFEVQHGEFLVLLGQMAAGNRRYFAFFPGLIP